MGAYICLEDDSDYSSNSNTTLANQNVGVLLPVCLEMLQNIDHHEKFSVSSDHDSSHDNKHFHTLFAKVEA